MFQEELSFKVAAFLFSVCSACLGVGEDGRPSNPFPWREKMMLEEWKTVNLVGGAI
jgi:hypothetical protein